MSISSEKLHQSPPVEHSLVALNCGLLYGVLTVLQTPISYFFQPAKLERPGTQTKWVEDPPV